MRRASRGMTLLESMIALLVMATGVAGLFGMIKHVQGANQNLAFQNASLDAFARLSAQLRDAQCDYPASMTPIPLVPGTTDPGLTAGLGAWFGAAGPAAGSSITFVGSPTTNPLMAQFTPPIAVDYMVTQDPASPPSLQIDVRVREIKRNATQDNAALVNGSWIRVFPVQKVCNPRWDPQGRGY